MYTYNIYIYIYINDIYTSVSLYIIMQLLNKSLVVNPPYLFSWLWTLVSPFLSERLVDKNTITDNAVTCEKVKKIEVYIHMQYGHYHIYLIASLIDTSSLIICRLKYLYIYVSNYVQLLPQICHLVIKEHMPTFVGGLCTCSGKNSYRRVHHYCACLLYIYIYIHIV